MRNIGRLFEHEINVDSAGGFVGVFVRGYADKATAFDITFGPAAQAFGVRAIAKGRNRHFHGLRHRYGGVWFKEIAADANENVQVLQDLNVVSVKSVVGNVGKAGLAGIKHRYGFG